MHRLITPSGRPLTWLLLALASASTAVAAELPFVKRDPAQDIRITRLAGLGKTWGAVKFLHPRLAFNGIDWDAALIEAIPKVRASRTSQDYAAAVDAMLSALDDPNTRARLRGGEASAIVRIAPARDLKPMRLDAGILVIDVAAASESDERNARAPAAEFELLRAQATAVLIDLRPTATSDSEEVPVREAFLLKLLPAILEKDLSLAARRYRIHNGYAPQKGSSTGGNSSGLLTTAPPILRAKSKFKTPPIAILVGAESASLDVVIALQSAGLAYVVQEGGAPRSAGTATMNLGENVEVTLATTELISAEGVAGFVPDEIVAVGQGSTAVRQALTAARVGASGRSTGSVPEVRSGEKDNAYPDMAFPPEEYRLLALYRYWNVINFFYPYKDLIRGDWDEVLLRYIPRFEANQSALEYETTVRALSVEIHDSHGFLGPTKAFAATVGAYVPPIVLRNVENQSMVLAVLDANVPLHVGDVITDIDGQATGSRRNYFASLYPASTPQAAMAFVQPFLLRGQSGSPARLTVRNLDGAIRTVQLERSVDAYSNVFMEAFARKSPHISVLPGGMGYVDLARLKKSEVDQMFESIKSTRATIFDMRGYPNGTAWTVAPRLARTRHSVAALFSRPVLDGASLEDEVLSDVGNEIGLTTTQTEQRLPDAQGDHYAGRVVVLIDESAASQAEHTCLFFEAATDVTFIGMPTAGVDGDVTNMILPGGITASFSGDAVRHADGGQLQRVGIQPTIRVAPTIAGIAAGRDEVLDAAIEFIARQSRSESP